MSDDSALRLVERSRAGDSQAQSELFDRYVGRLLAMVRKRISPRLAAKFDAEDVLQSAYRSFFRGVSAERYSLQDGDDLWRLLAAIALNKLMRQVERHTAQKRTPRLEVRMMDSSTALGVSPEQIAGEPAPDEALALEGELEAVMTKLDALERRMLELRLQGYTLEEISSHTNRSERTVRRLLKRLHEELTLRLSTTSTKDGQLDAE